MAKRSERSWRTDRGPLSQKLKEEFDKVVQAQADGSSGYVLISGGLATLSGNIYTASYGYTFSDVTTVVPFVTAVLADGTIGANAVATTQSVFSGSGASTVFRWAVVGK